MEGQKTFISIFFSIEMVKESVHIGSLTQVGNHDIDSDFDGLIWEIVDNEDDFFDSDTELRISQ